MSHLKKLTSLQTQNPAPGVIRDDSDDELGTDCHPWEWIYESTEPNAPEQTQVSRKRKRSQHRAPKIIGARSGSFVCRLGDAVLLRAEVPNEAWVGIICDLQDEEDDKTAKFMWFSSEKEIRNPVKKRIDFLPNELYITASCDYNSLSTINCKAHIMSAEEFSKRYPTGKVPRKSQEHGKVFICRRGCNTRTATYTEEFKWEEIYHGIGDLDRLVDFIQRETKATRRRRPVQVQSDQNDYAKNMDGHDSADGGSGKEAAVWRTPRKKKRSASTPKSAQRMVNRLVTPSHRKIMVKRHLEFTPLATRVLSPNHAQSSPYQLARKQLHVSSVPTSLPCREDEFSLVYSHLQVSITDGTGTCVYISGTPGTGKTATVREVVSQLDAAVRADELDDFIFVEINGMKITDPHQAYSLLWEALKGQRVSPAQALDLLEHEFSHPSPRRIPCVVLMDELDQLVTRNQGVMYNFFNWPGLRHSRLIVLAVANTMDLPERTLSNKISSRLGLTRITFPGYTHDQLMRIVQSRLEGVPGNIVDPDAVQFASRKVAAVSGDARRALDICRRAVELAEADVAHLANNPPTPSKAKGSLEDRPKKRNSAGQVTIETVRRAIAEATSSPVQLFLRLLPKVSRLLLSALLMRLQRSGLYESTYGEVVDEVQRALKMTGRSRPHELLHQQSAAPDTDVLTRRETRTLQVFGLAGAAVDLAGAGMINLEAQKAERPSRIKLAVSDEEVRLAFRDDPEMKELGISL